MTVLIIHGIEGHAGIHWQMWLRNELVKKGYRVLMPDMPKADHPIRKEWLEKVNKVTEGIDNELIIVAHSLGVPTALDFIQQSERKIKALVSVSGFALDYGAELNSYFLKERTVDFGMVKENLEKAFVLYGDDDPYVPQETLKSLADSLEVKPKVYPKGGHLNTDTGYIEFPDLLEIIISV
ncbi:serine hydrolase family protein [Candidatus Dojkabacteria bacterium]|nr:serine hydrolase family protein [Candidatus Dojkabacteria bacterium]